MDKVQYIAMCNKVIDNEDWYKRIPAEYVSKAQDEFYLLLLDSFLFSKIILLCFFGLLDSFHQGVITKDLYEALLVKHPVLPTFYSLPKTHKDLAYPPGRPIISGNGAYREQASQLIDKYLRPHVMALPSYVQDTPDLLRCLDNIQVPPDANLVAMDIEALYSSIPHSSGLSVIQEFLSERTEDSWSYSKFILTISDHILTCSSLR